MNEGDVVLIHLPQPDGYRKMRPALILKTLPGYDDILVCGISSNLNQEEKGIDEVLSAEADYFSATGLHQTSLIRLLYLVVQQPEDVLGSIGKISEGLHADLLRRLANFLTSQTNGTNQFFR